MANSALAIDTVTGGLSRVGGRFVRVTDATYQAQQIRSVLQFFLGEWYLDVTGVGVPYFQSILGKKANDLDGISDIYRTALLGLVFIASVDSISLDLSASTRRLTVTVGVTNTDGVKLADSFEVPV